MKYTLALFVLLILSSCGNNEEAIKTKSSEEETPTLEVLEETIATGYPAKHCLDSSWRVVSDIQEGFFFSYTIYYKSGKDTTVLANDSVPVLGAVDYPPAHYINDTTYFFPNVGGSSLGHFQLYIYKNGTCKYVEQISSSLSSVEIDSIKEERINPKGKVWHPVIYSTYSVNIESISFRRKATYYPNLNSPDSSSSQLIRFRVDKTEEQFMVEDHALATIGFFYSEDTPLYYAVGHQPYKGFIKGIKQVDNSWLIEIDLWLNIKKVTDNTKIEKHFQLKDHFITY
ncbi:MAG: hypothetical protein COA97_02045 [Flavobacteriales bacterium]|nr:MAG: hypothetical protein COA97_02045 [Flavobacteriales bacterium]